MKFRNLSLVNTKDNVMGLGGPDAGEYSSTAMLESNGYTIARHWEEGKAKSSSSSTELLCTQWSPQNAETDPARSTAGIPLGPQTGLTTHFALACLLCFALLVVCPPLWDLDIGGISRRV